MIAITDRQAEVLAKRMFQAGCGHDVTAADIKTAVNGLVDALNGGVILDSGDGYFYFLKRPYGFLHCQDGSVLTGSLFTQLSKCVWREKRLHEIFSELVQLELHDTNDEGYDPAVNAERVHEALMNLGAARHARTSKPH